MKPGADPGFVVRGGAIVGEGSGDRLRSPAGPRQSQQSVSHCPIHVIELLIFGWRFGLITGDFLSTYLMHVFIVY